MIDATPVFHAVVLAGDRTTADPVARHAGTGCKAATPVGGVPLLDRVVGTLRAVPGIGRIIVVGPARACLDRHPGMVAALDSAGVTRIDPEPSPSRSALRGLMEAGSDHPVLLTTVDHALLTPWLARNFMAASIASGGDLTVGLVPHRLVAAAFPGVRRTVLKLDKGYCTCNLFALLAVPGIRAVDAWVVVEQQRKHPARLVAGALGAAGLIRYLAGALSLDDAMTRASKRLGAKILPIVLDDPEASVDVDTPDDLRRVEQVLLRRRAAAASR